MTLPGLLALLDERGILVRQALAHLGHEGIAPRVVETRSPASPSTARPGPGAWGHRAAGRSVRHAVAR